jgi:hypothetical protein
MLLSFWTSVALGERRRDRARLAAAGRARGGVERAEDRRADDDHEHRGHEDLDQAEAVLAGGGARDPGARLRGVLHRSGYRLRRVAT